MKPVPVREIKRQENRQERPRCPRCNIELQLVCVTPFDHQERWLYHCGRCSYETRITVEALS
jgi:transcription elongation factor Elf1